MGMHLNLDLGFTVANMEFCLFGKGKGDILGGYDVNDLISSGWFLGITVSDRQFMITWI
jgi:hypothetical protein